MGNGISNIKANLDLPLIIFGDFDSPVITKNSRKRYDINLAVLESSSFEIENIALSGKFNSEDDLILNTFESHSGESRPNHIFMSRNLSANFKNKIIITEIQQLLMRSWENAISITLK